MCAYLRDVKREGPNSHNSQAIRCFDGLPQKGVLDLAPRSPNREGPDSNPAVGLAGTLTRHLARPLGRRAVAFAARIDPKLGLQGRTYRPCIVRDGGRRLARSECARAELTRNDGVRRYLNKCNQPIVKRKMKQQHLGFQRN